MPGKHAKRPEIESAARPREGCEGGAATRPGGLRVKRDDSEVVLVAGSVDVFALSAGGGRRWLLRASAGSGGDARWPARSGALADGGG